MEIFGFTISKKTKSDESLAKKTASPVIPSNTDGAFEMEQGAGAYSISTDFGLNAKTEHDLILKYREVSRNPVVEEAIDDVVNDAIITGDDKSPVTLNLDQLEDVPDNIKDKVHEEFQGILRLFDFNKRGYDIFRRWYIDGRVYFHMVLNKSKGEDKKTATSIYSVRPIDPLEIKKIREIKKGRTAEGVDVVLGTEEYFTYTPRERESSNNMISGQSNEVIKMSPDSIIYSHSGMMDPTNSFIISYLDRSIKPANQLNILEDAQVIYRLARAPERRIFYIDIGNMPKGKAEQYLKNIMDKYKNKLTYNSTDGKVATAGNTLSMLEDYWLPRREGGKGTQIDTLPGASSNGAVEELEFFKKKLYRSLKVPATRLDPDAGMTLGRSSEITRDELKFSRFIDRLRNTFAQGCFQKPLKTQLILKKIITEEDWDEWKDKIFYQFVSDSHFTELKENEIIGERLEMMERVVEHVGKYFSMEYVQKKVLHLTDEEIKEMDEQIAAEIKSGKLPDPAKQEDDF